MKIHYSLLLPLVVCGIANASQPMEAGLKIESLYSSEREADVEVYYWYPTQEKGSDFSVGNKRIFEVPQVKLNAPLADSEKPYPVILLAHGGMRSSFVHSGWIASELAKQGHIVVVPKTPPFNEINATTVTSELIQRPQDLLLGLNHIEQVSGFANRIDNDKISGVGFFLGGTSLLTLAGAAFDPDRYRRSCDDTGVSIDCGWLRKNSVSLGQVADSQILATPKDDRLSSLVVINPELSKALTTESLGGISVSVKVLDLIGKTQHPLEPAAGMLKLPSIEYQHIAAGSPFSAFTACTAKGKKVLEMEGEGEICQESGGKSRAEIHQEIIDEVLSALK